MNTEIRVQSLHYYPVKSLAGNNIEEMTIDPYGPAFDRHWMIIDSDGKFITQRTFPQLALVHSKVANHKLQISFIEMKNKTFELPLDSFDENDYVQANIWNDTVEVVPLDTSFKNFNLFLSNYLQTPCQLVKMGNRYKRDIPSEYAIGSNDQVSLADGLPLLLTTQSTLDSLNEKTNSLLGMNRFRPNIVVKGNIPAFSEHSWKSVFINGQEFVNVKACSRCKMIEVNQETGIYKSGPLKWLGQLHRLNNKIVFGINLIPKNEKNFISLNMPVQFNS